MPPPRPTDPELSAWNSSTLSRLSTRWYSERVGREVQVVRWGETGVPVLFFPTAAGDAEEVERFLKVDALAPLLEACRIQVYSVDSVPGQVWHKEDNKPPMATHAQAGFDGFVANELVLGMDAAHAGLAKLHERFILPAHCTGCWEDPAESWAVADVLGKRGIPNRVDEWGEEWDHDWPTWRRMLPQFLEERLDELAADKPSESTASSRANAPRFGWVCRACRCPGWHPSSARGDRGRARRRSPRLGSSVRRPSRRRSGTWP